MVNFVGIVLVMGPDFPFNYLGYNLIKIPANFLQSLAAGSPMVEKHLDFFMVANYPSTMVNN